MFMYDTLLEIVRELIGEQAATLQGIEFPCLSNIPSEVLLPGGKEECRQDHRLVGMAPDLRQQLLGSRENVQYYDLNVYLSKLVTNLHPRQQTSTHIYVDGQL